MEQGLRWLHLDNGCTVAISGTLAYLLIITLAAFGCLAYCLGLWEWSWQHLLKKSHVCICLSLLNFFRGQVILGWVDAGVVRVVLPIPSVVKTAAKLRTTTLLFVVDTTPFFVYP